MKHFVATVHFNHSFFNDSDEVTMVISAENYKEAIEKLCSYNYNDDYEKATEKDIEAIFCVEDMEELKVDVAESYQLVHYGWRKYGDE